MQGLKKSGSSSSSSYNSLYLNPLSSDKENVAPTVVDPTGCKSFKAANAMAASAAEKKKKKNQPLKPSSLQLCMKLNEPESLLDQQPPPTTKTTKKWGSISAVSSSSDMWDFSDSEAAPASSWSTLPNRSLLCRPLPMDVGRCSCVIVKERVEAVKGVTMSLYSLCTNEGHGRQDRKLAVARHKRQNGRSKFLVAQNPRGLLSSPDDSFLGTISANLMGSKFQIWDQSRARDSLRTQPKKLLGVVAFVPTVTTLTGSFRIMKINHINGLPKDWEKKGNKAHQLFSRAPHYNYASKRNELDFRERAGKTMPKIQTSVKNFQLTMEEKGKQTLLQFGKIGKSKYVMDYRYPLTGYQAFCICLASIDSKLCCSV